MSTEAHVAELRKKHEILSQKVEAAQKRPGSSDLEIADLKKQKLKLKEEITRLTDA